VPPTTTNQRYRILSAAAELFQRQGYPATSVRMIAAAVELGASSLYNHIDGKQELLKEICFVSAERFEVGLKTLRKKETSTSKLLKGLIHLHVHLAVTHPETVTVFNDEWRHLEQDAILLFLRKRKDYEQAIVEILTQGQREGSLPNHNLNIAVPALLGSMSWIYHRKELATNEIDQITEQLYTLWASGWQLK